MNDKPETGILAIEIDSPLTWAIICAIDPHFTELSYDDNVGRFLVLEYLGHRWMIMTPEMVGSTFDHITPSSAKLKFVNLIE